MPNPWEMDWSQPQQVPAYPGVIRGAPDPYKAEDQQMQREANDRANAAADRQAAASERQAAAQEHQQAMDAQGKEFQAKSASFYGRMLQSQQDYGAVGGDNLAPRGVIRQQIHDNFPNAENAFLNDSTRQSADQAARNFIAAQLRLESGAAISAAEYDNQYRIFFPMPGDSPEVIKQKAAARQQATEAMRLQAGPLADATAQTVQPSQKPVLADKPADGHVVIGYYRKDDGSMGPIYGAPGTPPPPGAIPAKDVPGGSFDPNGIGGLLELGKQGVTLGLADEAAGLGGAIGAGLTGNDPAAAYTRERDLARQNVAAARQAWPVLGTAVEFAGGGGAGNALSVPNRLAQVAGQGATLGGIAGFGYGEGGDSVPKALAGAATGGAIGAGLYGASAGLNALARRRAPNVNLEVVQAGQRQNIPVRQPDARPELRGKYATAESGQTSGPLIRASRADDAAAMQARAEQIGGGQAFPRADNTALGQRVQGVAERGQGAVKDSAQAIYKRVDRIVPGFSVPGTQTIAAIDAKIAKLQAQAPSGYTAEIQALQNMKADLQQTGLSVETLQAQRHTVGGRIGDNIADRTRADAALSEALDVAANELHSAMSATNPQAAALLKRADAKWGQYKKLQREVTTKFLGKRGDATAETAARELGALVNNQGNYNALRRFMTLATPEERADFATTFAQNWGADTRGAFSPAILAKNLEKQSDRTLDALFGVDGRKAMRDLQILANAKTDAMSRLSPSGQAMSGMAGGLKRLLWGALGLGATGNPAAAVAAGATQSIVATMGEQRAARMLLNPDFTKWLRNAPNTTNPRAIDRYFAKLGTIGSIAANDNAAFVGAVRQGFAGSPGAAAAQNQQDAGQKPPQQ